MMKSDQATIHFEIDQDNKIIRLSMPIYDGQAVYPKLVANFFISQSLCKKYFCLNDNREILFNQEFSSYERPRLKMREKYYQFLRNASRSRHYFSLLEQSERLQDVQSLLES